MIKTITFTLLILFGLSNNSIAQRRFSHEIGVIGGPVELRSDYGQRNNSSNNFNNSGFGVGFVHYLNFSYLGYANYSHNTYFREHFKVRSEISYNKTKLEHFGKWVEEKQNTIGVQQLKAMRGSTSLLNFGMQLEYTPINIHDFENTDGSFSPYISLGAQLSKYNTEATSTLGPLGSSLTTFPKYLTPSAGHPHGFSTENGTTLSIVSSIGTRYKLSPLQDLIIDLRLQYFDSDWIDGLNPNRTIYTENKTNDWLIWLNVGYIYYLSDN